MNYLLHLIIYFDIYVIVALSLNLVVGYAGILTLAHAAYFAVGGYAYALLTLILGWDFFVAAMAAALIAAMLSLALSLPSWRLRGDFFILGSLAVQVLIFSAVRNWASPNAPLGSWTNLTNGLFGIPGIPKPDIFGFSFTAVPSYALFATFIAAACGFLLWCLKSSPWGRLLLVMREDELAARGLGKNTRLLKVQVFAFSCAFAAIAGALYAGYVSYLDPSSASLDESILMLSMVLVGGLGNFRGPIVGAAVLIALPEILRLVAYSDAQAAQLRLLIYGLLLVLLVHFRPAGIAGNNRMD